MKTIVTSRSGLRLERTSRRIDYLDGIAFLADKLDSEKGAYFSSGVEYPDRYSRWEFGFVNPPLEIVGRAQTVSVNALNPRGERLLGILSSLFIGAESRVTEQSPRRLVLEILPSQDFFPEEERSRQPSLFSPIRRVIEDFRGAGEPLLGFFGAFGYDLILQFNPVELAQQRDGAQKDFHLFIPDQMYLVDRRLETAQRLDFVFTRGTASTKGVSRKPFHAAGPIPPSTGPDDPQATATNPISSDHRDADFAATVDEARQRMVAGDVFEVVLSRRFTAPYAGRPSHLFAQMKQLNPSPYEFFIQLGDEQLVGASPEMFVRVEGDRVESCPIAGTIRRGRNAMEDAECIRTLINSRKDEAELTMCTDVDRNDKARICVPGSVRLLERRLIEKYAGLFHTVDHVEGRLRYGFTGIDAFLSHMWAVTLTGAPKTKAVSIVEEMEGSPREWYGGAVGGLTFDGGVNTGITIRTIHLRAGEASYRAGASLVYDSVGVEEEQETRTKATAFFHIMDGAPEKSAALAASAMNAEQPGAARRVLMIDNDDSFVHTLADYFRQAGAEVSTYRWDTPVGRIVEAEPDLVVHSPGPGRPADFGLPDLVRDLAARRVPQFGVCLGLQGIVEAFGGMLAVLDPPRHGKVWEVSHNGRGIFSGLPTPCTVGAYHSLHAPKSALPDPLELTGWTKEGLVMGVRHRTLPIAAVQFHPESILSMDQDIGLRFIGNVVRELTATVQPAPPAVAI